LRRVRRAVAVLCGGIFAAIFGVFCFGVVRRYAFGDALAWGEELTVILFIWLIFLANAVLVPDERQIRFDLLIRAVPRQAARWLEMLRAVVVGGLFLAALPGAVGYIRFLWRERTPVLQWPLDWVYACFGVFMVAVILRQAALLLRRVR
jgi:TRAP-type C4-dicarboxylate transport system permease small subunit